MCHVAAWRSASNWSDVSKVLFSSNCVKVDVVRLPIR